MTGLELRLFRCKYTKKLFVGLQQIVFNFYLINYQDSAGEMRSHFDFLCVSSFACAKQPIFEAFRPKVSPLPEEEDLGEG